MLPICSISHSNRHTPESFYLNSNRHIIKKSVISLNRMAKQKVSLGSQAKGVVKLDFPNPYAKSIKNTVCI